MNLDKNFVCLVIIIVLEMVVVYLVNFSVKRVVIIFTINFSNYFIIEVVDRRFNHFVINKMLKTYLVVQVHYYLHSSYVDFRNEEMVDQINNYFGKVLIIIAQNNLVVYVNCVARLFYSKVVLGKVIYRDL